MMKKKANDLVSVAKSLTTYGNWIFDFNELTIGYGIDQKDYDELLKELQNHSDVLDVELNREEGFLDICIAGDFT